MATNKDKKSSVSAPAELSSLQFKDKLASLALDHTLHPFLLISAPSPRSASLLADWLAMLWVGADKNAAHPDIVRVKNRGKSGIYTIESIREILSNVSMTSYQGNGKVFLIENGEMLSPQAAQALLKALEEPPSDVLFLITTAHLQKILPTILSRAEVIRCRAMAQEMSSPKVLSDVEHIFSPSIDRPLYEELVQAASLLQEVFKKKLNSATSHLKEDFADESEREAAAALLRYEIGEALIMELFNLWKAQLLQRGVELRTVFGRLRFPDESISFFDEALKKHALQMDVHEVFLQLLLQLFGLSRAMGPSYDFLKLDTKHKK